MLPDDLPDDLPHCVEYLLASGTVLSSLCRRPVAYIGSNGATDASTIRPRIPIGTVAWRRAGETEWQALSAIPANWLPFLNRERKTEMDPRPVKEDKAAR